MATQHGVVRRKLVIVGDSICGKTSLLRTVLHGSPGENLQNAPYEQVPGTYECSVLDGSAQATLVQLVLWDSAGAYEYNRLEPLKYPKANIILIGFSVDSPDSLESVEDKWIQEVVHFCPDIPIVLVGLKADLRAQAGETGRVKCVERPACEAVARSIGAYKYVECSSMTGEGVEAAFEAAAKAALQGPKKKRKSQGVVCCVVT